MQRLPATRFDWRRAVIAALVLAGIWWVFAPERGSWIVGVPTVLIAASLLGRMHSSNLAPRLRRLPAFAVWFARQSVRGGVDVALRALRPGPPVRPGLLRRRTLLHEGARTLLANVVTLLPGTLAVRLEGEQIEIHVIDRSAPIDTEVDGVEGRIAVLVHGPTARAPR